MSPGNRVAGVRAILLDVEGTTTPLAFIADVLVPYARGHLRHHIEQYAHTPEYVPLVEQLRQAHAIDCGAGQPVPAWVDAPDSERLESAIEYLEWLMEKDRKSTVLKALQGRIWEEGYQRGQLKGEVFADVPASLTRWQAQGLDIGIFSSGSILAQQLLFRHSSAGDLTPFLRWYFDTTTGAKTDAASYRRIAAAMAIPPEAVLFVSDVVRELDGAQAAGMRTRLSARPGNSPPPPDHGYTVVRTLDDIG